MFVDGEIIETQRGSYRRVCAQTIDRHVVGIDVGNGADYTAICVINHSVRALETWTPHHPRTLNHTGRLMQDVETFFDVRALGRLDLHVSYPEQVKRIEEILAHPRLRKADVVVSATGVGTAITDMFETMVMSPIRVIITAGTKPVRHSEDRYSVPKDDVVGAILAQLHNKQLRFGADLKLLEQLREELNSFQFLGRSPTGQEHFVAHGKDGKLVLALALACWWATSATKLKLPGEVSIKHIRGLY
jgi:hypothetical protein